MSVVTGFDVGMDVLKVLGIENTRVSSVTIHIEAAEVVTITIKKFPTKEELEGIVSIISKYHLVKYHEQKSS